MRSSAASVSTRAAVRSVAPCGALIAALFAALLAAGNASADAPPAAAASGVAAAAEPGARSVEPPALLSRRPVSVRDLERQRGTGSSSSSTVVGTLSDTTASQVVTGNNQITAGAFAGASGVPVVIQNSGNNVLIQSSTVINVQLK